jgi:hypothetical protein
MQDVRPIGDGGGMEDDGGAERGRTRLARGTKPHALSGQAEIAGDASPGVAAEAGRLPAGGAPSSAGRAPAQSIREAVEQLIEAQEADEAIAEWMQGGG